MGELPLSPLFNALAGLHVEQNVSLSALTTMRIGGPADAVLYAQKEEDILLALSACASYDIPVHILGNGSNILVRDGGIRGLVILIGKEMQGTLLQEGNSLTARAGMALSTLVKAALSRSLQGLEWAYGIPGTVGGACAMNAGAYGGEIAQRLIRVRVLEQGKIEERTVAEGDLAYRKSIYAAPSRIVLSATFLLEKDDGGAKTRQEEYAAKRREKQPLSFPSAGSTFKRPEGYFAGALIEGAGLKGTKIGGAMVSELHAGFLVNAGGATGKDMIALVELVQAKVQERFGVRLEPEIKIWGEEA